MTIIDHPQIEHAVPEWQTLRELRPAASQLVFRAMMNAVARPGTVHKISARELPLGVPAAVLPLLALADIMTPIGALSPAVGTDATSDAVATIGRVVGARVVDASKARYALALSEPAHLEQLSPGTHWSPEKGATLVQRVEVISIADADSLWRLSGPGIPPHAPVELRVDGLSERFVAAREALVSDYPAGIDSILITDGGELIALSRTTRIERI